MIRTEELTVEELAKKACSIYWKFNGDDDPEFPDYDEIQAEGWYDVAIYIQEYSQARYNQGCLDSSPENIRKMLIDARIETLRKERAMSIIIFGVLTVFCFATHQIINKVPFTLLNVMLFLGGMLFAIICGFLVGGKRNE